ncbi:Terpene synthase family, metal binding domain [Micromonospora echinofusca]|uniref:Terpene synthase family, metal binding domain n=1 Tax=Micromonospora echinofusca TaxID=47858 RepID=A0A1C5G6G8_MICEH|nr:terpene synthase family protein [Micromonospora echinofusca]SCG15351.1 Terpene synthase family, metal binding domain [Micromonospora echinofusca]
MTALPAATPEGRDELRDAQEQGRICGLAVRGQRDLQASAAARPELFPAEPFDTMLFANISLAIAFGAPWCTAEQLRAANRTVLWGFALDWLIDHRARTRDEVDGLVARCRVVAAGEPPAADDHLGAYLAALQEELATVPAFAAYRPLWRDRVDATVRAMAREWEWKAAWRPGDRASLPSLDAYLDNADNHACTIVNVAHWLYTGDEATLARLDELVAVSDQVQRALRLVNDLGTYERDLRWGDLNALLLVEDRAEVEQRLATLVDSCRRMLVPLRTTCPREADYLARQVGFSSGFYQLADFWGMS